MNIDTFLDQADREAQEFLWTIDDEIKQNRNKRKMLEQKRLRLLQKLEENDTKIKNNDRGFTELQHDLQAREEHLENVRSFKKTKVSN